VPVVIDPSLGFAAAPVAGKMVSYTGERLCELGSDLMPLDVRLRPAVQEQNGRPAPADHAVDSCASGLLAHLAESREEFQGGSLRLVLRRGGLFGRNHCTRWQRPASGGGEAAKGAGAAGRFPSPPRTAENQ